MTTTTFTATPGSLATNQLKSRLTALQARARQIIHTTYRVMKLWYL